MWTVVLAFDLRQYLGDLWQVHVRRLHKKVFRETEGDLARAATGRFAVVALYPSNDSLPFTLNLLDVLAETDLWVLVVCTRELAVSELVKIKARASHVIERANVGQDFGSYQIGIEWLERHRQLRSAELLILANDSMFYPKAFAAEAQRMLQRPSPWQSLFENYEHHYHAQSFFLLFRAAVLESAVFWDFWAQYRPYSARVHAIHRGEGGLTQDLMRAGFSCDPAYSSRRLAEELADAPLTLPQLIELMPCGDHWEASRHSVFQSMTELERLLGEATEPRAPADAEGYRQRTEELFWRHWALRVVHQFEASNPTHVGGLLCNRLFSAPLKRDVCYRDIFDISQILRSVTGFDDEEIVAMHRDLRRRGLGSRMPIPRRWLYLKGRL